MEFGRKNDSQEDEAKAEQKALREKAKIEARELKQAEREAKAQQRTAEQKVREQEKIAKSQRELELYGRKVIEEACARKLVRIYDKGFVRVSGVIHKDGAVFEKLRAISSSADVAKKTALGRTLMATATMGLSLVTPNKRGDMYLTINTDKTTHMLHVSPPTERELKAMHKIATAGQGILDSIERQLPVENSRNASIATVSSQPVSPQASIIDELTKLVALRDAGAISEDEFSAMKSQLMGGSLGIADGTAPKDIPEKPTAQEYFDVELLDALPRSIKTIKVIRKFTYLGLAEAKKKVDSTPVIVGTSLSHDYALQFVEELRWVGATAEMR